MTPDEIKVIPLPPDRRGPARTKPAAEPPNNPEFEQSVLGAVLVRPEVMAKVADILQPADFYRAAHGASTRPCWTSTAGVSRWTW